MKGSGMDERRVRVLVIDDDARLGRLVGRMLERDYAVTVVTSGREALNRVAIGARFELILCDVMMPQMTGMRFFDHLGAVAPELLGRVVFWTGGAFGPGAEAFLKQPFIHQIEKPCALAELRHAVMTHLERLARDR